MRRKHRRRLWEIGALIALLTTLVFIGYSYLALRAYRQRLNTQLRTAILNQDFPTIMTLVRKGADLRIKGILGMTALSTAAGFGTPEEIRELISRGADPNLRDGQFTPLLVAVQRQREDNLRTLLEAGANPNAEQGYILRLAIQVGNLEILRELIRHGADVNTRGRQQTSMLAYAEAMGRKEMVRMLKKAGAVP